MTAPFDSSIGFPGSVGAGDLSRMLATLGARYVVGAPTELTPTVSGSLDRTVNYAVGSLYLGAVRGTASGVKSMQHTTNGAGSDRFDLVVARFNFAANTATLAIKPGIAGAGAPPAATFDFSTTYECPVCAVKIRPGVALLLSSDLYDLRLWGAGSGPLQTPQASFYTVHDLPIGGRIKVQGTDRVIERTGTSTWADLDTGWTTWAATLTSAGGTLSLGTGGTVGTFARYRVRGKTLEIHAEFRTGTAGVNGGTGDITMALPPGFTATSQGQQTIICRLYNNQLIDSFTGTVTVAAGATVIQPKFRKSSTDHGERNFRNAVTSAATTGESIPLRAGAQIWDTNANLIIQGAIEIA